jgi:periplasmic protein TonB
LNTAALPSFAQPLLEPRNRVLMWALGFSIGLHLALLTIKFVAPETFRLISGATDLEVVLVNAKNVASSPKDAQALAQVNLEGGGDADKGIAKSPLPNMDRVEDGDDLQRVKQKIEQLEAEQSQLLAALKNMKDTRAALQREITQASQSGQDKEDTEANLARAIAALEKRVEDYNKRPRRKAITPSTREVEYATYYVAWREKVERIGTENYPAEARGKLYGELIVTVSIFQDGSIEGIELVKSSGQPVLDKAALRIVKLAAPYGSFPKEMRDKYQIFDITTRFVFTKGEGFEARSLQ